MSIHGVCYDESQSGNCGTECEMYQDGDCEIPGEILELIIDKEELIDHYLLYPEDIIERTSQARMLENDIQPVKFIKKVIKSEFNSKCWICGAPVNKIGRLSYCKDGCK